MVRISCSALKVGEKMGLVKAVPLRSIGRSVLPSIRSHERHDEVGMRGEKARGVTVEFASVLVA